MGQPVSDALKAMCAESHRVDVRVDVLDPTGTTTLISDLALVDGDVSEDATSVFRRSARIVTEDPAAFPLDDTHPLLPWSTNQVKIRAGIGLSDGTTEWCLLGMYWIDSLTVRRPDGTVEVGLVDGAALLERAILTGASRPLKGNKITAECYRLMRQVLGPTWPINTLPPLDDNPVVDDDRTYTPGETRASIIEAYCDAIGADWYFSRGGTMIIRDTPVAGTPVAVIKAGPGGTMTRSSTAYIRATNYTRVRFEPATPTKTRPARVGTAEQTTGAHRKRDLYVGNGYSRRTGYRTQAAADAAAQRYLSRELRQASTVTLWSVPLPWVEVGDTVTVGFASGAVEDRVVSIIRYPLAAGRDAQYTLRSAVFLPS